MAAKPEKHLVKLIGPGLSFERPVTEEVANSIINLVMTGVATTAVPAASGAGSPTGEVTPKQFIAQKRPSTDYQRVACLAYYLTHYRGTPQFKVRDIRNLCTEAALHLANPSRDLQHATSTYFFLVRAGASKKQITSLGEAVVEALPDKEKVKAAIEEHKPRRRKKRSAKK